MGLASVLRQALCLQETVIESLRFESDTLVLRVRPRRRDRNRCARCMDRCRFHDAGTRNRRWRSIDLGSLRVYLEADTHRVRCPKHGVLMAHVPWARPKARFTCAMDDLVSWLATESSQSMIAGFARTSWRSVGRAIARVVSNTQPPLERLTDLRRIGIDEISYRKGHRHLTVVVDHDTGQLIWAAAGANGATLNRFFDELGEERCGQIQAVTRDAATWIMKVVSERCPNAVQCMDPFHVIKWATDAVDQMRRDAWRGQRYRGVWGDSSSLKGARWALLKNEEDLTAKQQDILREIRRINEPLSRAHLLKEALRRVFRLPLVEAIAALRAWLSWAFRCQIPAFVKIAKSIQQQLPAIQTTLEYRLSNGRVEAMNTSIRLISRRAYGFHSASALIGMAMLKHGGLRPALPGR